MSRERSRVATNANKVISDNVQIDKLVPYAKNARKHSNAQIEKIMNSIKEFGFVNPIAVWKNNEIIAGHGRVMAAKKLLETGNPRFAYLQLLPVRRCDHLSDKQRRALILADNRIAEDATWDDAILEEEIKDLAGLNFDLTLAGFEEDEIKIDDINIGDDEAQGSGTLSDKFLIPPFSVMNAREGWWQDRKRAWIGLGIKSELGRGSSKGKKGNAAPGGAARPSMKYSKDKARGDGAGKAIESAGQNGTSIFDPVLCEIAYRWFSPKGGQVLDPFAGGSVRGIVAAKLGRDYFGIDLREEQIEANQEQAKTICKSGKKPVYKAGDSKNIDKIAKDVKADLVFSCPPYADLEIYSDNPNDLSNMDYMDFRLAYAAIIRKACEKLKNDRFAVFVVGEVRDNKGNYYNLVGDTISAFKDAGLKYYNEGILLTVAGSLPIRAAKQFSNSRKLGKTHQNILVFVKGDGKKAAEACGLVETYTPDFAGDVDE